MPVVYDPKLCVCGCGETFTPVKTWQKFKNREHQEQFWVKVRQIASDQVVAASLAAK
jgi:hypothetical protein